MTYNPEIHHRRSIRLKGYDYTQPGAYFVTLVTHHREEIFGEIINGEMKLSPLGEIVRQEWFRSGEIRREIQLFEDEFAIMPNHGHGVVWIVDGVRPEEDGVRPSLHRAPRSLGSFIAGFKASVTSRAKHELNMTRIWQRNYFEHIIRNEAEFHNIWNYIDANPLHWQAEQLHPFAPLNKYNQE